MTNRISYADGVIVPAIEDAHDAEAAEAHGFSGEIGQLAAAEDIRSDDDDRVCAVRAALQFIHDAKKSAIALHQVAFVAGCFAIHGLTASNIAKRLKVSASVFGTGCHQFEQMISDMLDDWKSPRVLKAIAGIIAEIGESKQPGLAALQLAAACGIDLDSDLSESKRAENYGITKQGFNQGKKRFRQRLKMLRPARNEKHQKDKFSTNNYRHPKKQTS